MTRVECLKQIIALEETRAKETRRLEALHEKVRGLYKQLPKSGQDRVTCLKSILIAEEESEKTAGRLFEINKRLQELRRDMPAKPGGRKAHGELRKIMLSALKAAGGKGVRVQTLARRHRLDTRSVHAALSGYLKEKTMPGLQRIGRGHYALIGRK